MELFIIIAVVASVGAAAAGYFAGKREVSVVKLAAEKELAAAKEVAEKEQSALKEVAERELAALKESARREVASLKESYDGQIVLIRESGAKQVEQQREAYEQQLKQQRIAADKQIAELRVASENQMAELRSANERQLVELKEGHQKQIEAIKQMNREQMESQLNLIKEQMQTTSEKVLKMRQEELGKANSEQMTKIVDPLTQSFKQIKEQMAKMEESVQKVNTESAERKVSITQTIEALAKETMKVGSQAEDLAKALKNKSKVQGDWGEQVLENILEGSGLRRGEDYLVQHNVKGEGNENLRPDIIVKCPGDKNIVIDSKVSLSAYLDYVSAENPEEQKKAAKENYDSVKKHIDELSAKNYEKLVGNTISHVLMFIPNEGSYILALQHDPRIAQYAFGKNVLLINPTNLMMSLKLIYNIWQSERQSRNVETIVQESTGLYEKFAGFLDSFSDIGKKIDSLHSSFANAENQLCTGRGNLIKRVESLKDKGILPKKSIPDKFLDKSIE